MPLKCLYRRWIQLAVTACRIKQIIKICHFNLSMLIVRYVSLQHLFYLHELAFTEFSLVKFLKSDIICEMK